MLCKCIHRVLPAKISSLTNKLSKNSLRLSNENFSFLWHSVEISTETLRKGNDIVWDELWKRISKRLGGDLKFKEYIPPHKNLGAVFIRSYNNI